MRYLLSFFVAALTAPLFAAPAQASDPVVVVELFTSQGCYSCPPADEMLGKLAKRDDVVPLALHVDYWDYLGWKDTFADKSYTERQIGYRDSFGARMLYTPQMVVQGQADVVGSRSGDVEKVIAAARPDTAATIEISVGPDSMQVRCAPGATEPHVGGTVWAAVYDREATVEIARGENAGKSLTYHNIVRKLVSLGTWDGTSEQEFDLPEATGGQGIAVWVQDGSDGAISAAAKYEL